jgi:hypothetical protein
MAKKEANKSNVTTTVVTEPTFTKKQFLNSNTYRRYRDAVNVLLKDDRGYTKVEVEQMLKKFYNK